jgi:CheY-like chemotaxis protein
VVGAQSAGEALVRARELRPDAITLDVMLPAVDGWEVLQKLRAHPQTRHIPVLVCSVLKGRDLALSLGAAGFLAKPVNRDGLMRSLAELRLLPAP